MGYTKFMPNTALLVLALLSFVFFLVVLQIKGIVVLPASAERCAKLQAVLTDSQIRDNQEYWDRRCGN